MDPTLQTELDSRVIKAALEKGLISPEVAQDAQRLASNQTSATAILIRQRVLTQHIVDHLGTTPGTVNEPQAIAGFKIIGKLGQGGMGTVYRALQVSMNRVVALKVISRQYAADVAFCDRFLREARAAGQINHPNVITCYDVGQADGWLYMALELMSGGDATFLAKKSGGRLNEPSALRVIADCARGLVALKRAGLIHRDIKPANIFISEDGIAKLGDLGLARSTSGDDRMTLTGAAMGTPAFMSPEQASGDAHLDIRTDIYALGATLFSLMTGDTPFKGASAFAVVAKVINDPVPDPRSLNENVSDAAAAIIMTAMAKDRDHRFVTPEALIEDLERALTGREPLHAPPRPRSSFAATVITPANGLGVLQPTTPLTGHSVSSRPGQPIVSSATTPTVLVPSNTVETTQPPTRTRTKWLPMGGIVIVVLIVMWGIAVKSHQNPRNVPSISHSGLRTSPLENPRSQSAKPDPPEIPGPKPVFDHNGRHLSDEQIALVSSNTSSPRATPGLALPDEANPPAVPTDHGTYTPPQDVNSPEHPKTPSPEIRIPIDSNPPVENKSPDNKPPKEVASPPVKAPENAPHPRQRAPVRPLRPLAKPLPTNRMIPPGQLAEYRAQLKTAKLAASISDANDGGVSVQIEPGAKDISGLAGIPITHLECEGCTRLNSIEVLRGMPLRTLSLRTCTGIKDLAPLEELPLEELDLTNCDGIEGDLSVLKKMPITELHLAGCRRLTSLAGIEGMRLSTLDLTDCKNLTSLAPIQGLPLKQLCLLRCKGITNLEPLAGMGLTQLDLTGCSAILTLEPLQTTRLAHLNLEDCRHLTSLVGLDGTMLTDLTITKCPALKDLSGLEGMKLKRLILVHCDGLSSLNGLKGNPIQNLEVTSCDQLQGDLSALEGLPLLTVSLRDCPGLESLHGLERAPLRMVVVASCKRLKDTDAAQRIGVEFLRDRE